METLSLFCFCFFVTSYLSGIYRNLTILAAHSVFAIRTQRVSLYRTGKFLNLQVHNSECSGLPWTIIIQAAENWMSLIDTRFFVNTVQQRSCWIQNSWFPWLSNRFASQAVSFFISNLQLENEYYNKDLMKLFGLNEENLSELTGHH